MKYLNIPGLNNSGPGHWQTIWEDIFPQAFNRVQQVNWSSPVKNEWVATLHDALASFDAPVVLVAHSLGCISVVHWANENKFAASNITGALLVAPADAEHARSESFKSFCPVPKIKLPFPSMVVASANDPYTTTENSAKLASWWGSKFICVGDKGHINAQSALGDWKEGLSLLAGLTDTIATIHTR